MTSLNRINERLSEAFNIFFPYQCPGCGNTAKTPVCADCERRIRYVTYPYCEKCGRPLPSGTSTTTDCRSCRDAPPHYDAARSVLFYDSPVKEIIIKYKFNKSYRMGDYLRKSLATRVREEPEFFSVFERIDYVTPVPLHALRFIQRGFNQSHYLAREAKIFWGGKIEKTLLRTRNTKKQSLLPVNERHDNVKNAFALGRNARVEGRVALLVDDVVTTGSTVDECARVLKESGAKKVYVLAFARGGKI